MKKCWASVLGDCDDKISREHTITAGLFLEDKVKVKGFAWCKDEFKEIGLEGLTRKVLCTRHNSILSQVDQGGIDAIKVFREELQLDKVRETMPSRIWNIIELQINGPLLERWFAKTLINCAFGQPYKIGTDANHLGEPSERIVKAIFGLGDFGNKAGLYGLGHVGLDLKIEDGLNIITMLNDDVCIGAVFLFHGYRFFIYLEQGGLLKTTRLPALSKGLGRTRIVIRGDVSH